MTKCKDVDLKNVTHIFDYFMRCYGNEITDKTNLKTAIITNRYVALTCFPDKQSPMINCIAIFSTVSVC